MLCHFLQREEAEVVLVWHQDPEGPGLTVCSWLCVCSDEFRLTVCSCGVCIFPLWLGHTDLRTVQVLESGSLSGLWGSNSHSSTVWWFCRFPEQLKRWCSPLDGRRSRSRRLCVLVVSERSLWSEGSRCKPCCPLSPTRSTSLLWRRSWRRCSTFHSYGRCTSSDTFLCCSPRALTCCPM